MIKLGSQGLPDSSGMTDAERYKALADAGFFSIDYGLMQEYTSEQWQLSDCELEEKMKYIKEEIHKNGLIVGQTHSPLDGYWGNDISTKEARWHAQIQAIKATAYLECPYIVIHPLTMPYDVNEEVYEKSKAINMEYYNFLKPYLEEYNVKAAIENLFTYNPILGRNCKTACSTPENLKDYIDTLNSDRFVVCLDVGHAALTEQDPVEMIYALGNKYLHVTHMHDNNYWNDDHAMPGCGKINWKNIGKALNDIGFEGIFNYEAAASFFRLGTFGKKLTKEMLQIYAQVGKVIIQTKE